ncbi:MAG: hypothetical protein KDK25_16100, partial [Leptospiraceae bacterium]|nr:hypothetical protein [Leptospiraceae bacterium]
VPTLDLKAQGAINLFEALPFLNPPESYDREAEKRKLAYGLVHELQVESLSGGYNGSQFQATASIVPGEGVDADVRIQGFNLGQFLAPTVTGLAGLNLKARSTESFEELEFDGTLNIGGGRYALGRSRSGINNLNLAAAGRLLLKDEETSISIERLNLQGYNETGLLFLALAGSADLNFQKGAQTYDARIGRLALNYAPLMATLPARIRYPIRPYGAYLKEGLILSLQTSVQSREEGTSIQGNGNLTVPAISQDALNLSVQTDLSEGRIGIPMLRIAGLRGALNATLSGSLNTGERLQPYLQFRL